MAMSVLARRGRIYFIRASDTIGRHVHYFLQVSSPKEGQFRKAMGGSAMIDYSHFGNIIASGYGHAPTPAVEAMLARDYHYRIPA